MSKNFRSSFIDLLCCHYSKHGLFCMNESMRNRRMTDTNYNATYNRPSIYCKSDYLPRTSVISRFSQLTPMINANGFTTSSSLSPIANELSPMYMSSDDRTGSTETTSPAHVAVELNEKNRAFKQNDRLSAVSYSSIGAKPSGVLCT